MTEVAYAVGHLSAGSLGRPSLTRQLLGLSPLGAPHPPVQTGVLQGCCAAGLSPHGSSDGGPSMWKQAEVLSALWLCKRNQLCDRNLEGPAEAPSVTGDPRRSGTIATSHMWLFYLID